MKIKTGTDIIEIARIQESIEKYGEKFLNTIYTEQEIDFCEKHKNQKYQHYAVRFAAKEAAFKALSFFYEYCDWKKFEIISNSNGKPILKINDDISNLEDIDISLSHCKDYAVANVVALIRGVPLGRNGGKNGII